LTGEEFIILWANKQLRQFVVDKARCRSKSKEIQTELIQEAWLAISTVPNGDYCIESYEDIAEKAIRSGYWQEKKEELVLRSVCLQYGRNPFDEREIWVNCKNPIRATD
jgi:hypothetical protein